MNIFRSRIYILVMVFVISGIQCGLCTITMSKELPDTSLKIVTRDEVEHAHRAVEDVFFVILPDSNILYERFAMLRHVDNEFAGALEYFAKKSRLIECVAAQEISLVVLNDCIKQELNLFIENSRSDALAMNHCRPLLEQDFDVVVTCVIGILLKHYRNQTLYLVTTDL